MKHLLGGVAIGAVLAIAVPVWAQQNPNTPPAAATQVPPAGQTAQPATGAAPVPAAPQAQSGQRRAPEAQAPGQPPQNAEQQRPQNATGGREETRTTEARPRHHRHFGRYYGRGLAYRMGVPARHWHHAESWRMHHHHWMHAQAWRFRHHHWRYAHGWGWGYRYGWRHWPNDFVAGRLNRQELGTLGTTTQYYGASGPAMAYTPSAGYGAAPMGPAPGSVLWYPPRTNPPSPPGFPPAFYGTWGWGW